MADEHIKAAIEVYTRQHEFYAEQTALALQFPIKLILTLNSSAVAASLLLVREAIGSNTKQPIIDAVRSSFWAFGGGIVCVLIASWFQWQLYAFIMHRKRTLLRNAISAADWNAAMSPFYNEPSASSKTSLHNWCFVFVVLSFVSFLAGAYILGSRL
ncbi:hypothetical protein DYY88_23895 [Leptolyngbya iicbica LK]|uniref:DUF202 domain-containing protein n=1 Tax=Leptolyngbya iicbica LK TaxID=2294035 RepID=A0A4Q7E0F3_9CYAN|nr:hypothetical protein [Leptolyngbya sp. LK]RZM74092.1 hypothetical protein DYY88_23895 [Leptolyngbya sp. LK]